MTKQEFNTRVKQIENATKGRNARISEISLANNIMALINEFEQANYGQKAY